MSSVSLSVCLSVCDVGGLWSHRLEFFRNNFEWPYLRNGSRSTYIARDTVIFAIAQLSCLAGQCTHRPIGLVRRLRYCSERFRHSLLQITEHVIFSFLISFWYVTCPCSFCTKRHVNLFVNNSNNNNNNNNNNMLKSVLNCVVLSLILRGVIQLSLSTLIDVDIGDSL